MSAIPQALPLPRHLTESRAPSTAVSKTNPNIKWLLTMVKGQNRPPESEMRAVGERHARDEDVPVIWEVVGIYSSKGRAEKAIEWKMKRPHVHDRDKYQIAPFVEDAILPRARIHLADDEESPPATEYAVVRKADLELLVKMLEPDV